MSSTFKHLGQSELLPRYIFAESLFARRRVLEVGAVASTRGQSAQFLATRGARIVVAADSNLEAVREAQARLAGPNLRFRPTVFDDFEAGSFDLVMVTDLAPYVRAPELLRELARLVARGGYLMGGLRNPAGLALANVIDPDGDEAPPTYGQLLDAFSTHFESIEVATQSAVLGYQLAFERGEGLQVDGSLAGASEAAYFIVMAGHEPVRHFDPTWVQLPPEPLAFTGGKLEDATHRARDWKERTERLKETLDKKSAQLDARESELKEARERLEAAQEAVSRLTAQLESLREKPDVSRDKDELATRARQLEAELAVFRDRALDAEARAGAARSESQALERAQKDAAVQALAAAEQARLERARREEIGTQLEDSRLRLARLHQDLGEAQASLLAQRLEQERAKAEIEALQEVVASKEADVRRALEREQSLADARTEGLKAIEHLEHGLAEAKVLLEQARQRVDEKEAERLSVLRGMEAEGTIRRQLELEGQRANARMEQLGGELAASISERAGLETELSSARAALGRAQRDSETLAHSERTWRETAEQYLQRLSDVAQNVDQLSDQVAQAEAARDAEVSRAKRLELDLGTAVTAERTAHQRTEAQLLAAQAGLLEKEEGFHTAQEVLRTTQEELRIAREDLRTAQGEHRTAREELRTAQDELGATQAGLREAQGQLEVALQEAEHLRAAQRDQAEREAIGRIERAELETSLASAQEAVAGLERTAQEAQEAKEAARVRERDFQMATAALQERLGAAEAELGRQRADLEQASAGRQEADARRDEALRLKTASEEALRAQERRATALELELEALRATHAQAASDLEALQSESKAQAATLRAEREGLEQLAEGLRKALGQAGQELDTQRADFRAREGALQATIEELQQSVEREQEKTKGLLSDHEQQQRDWEQEKSGWEQQLQAERGEKKALEAQRERLVAVEQQLEEGTAQRAELESRLEKGERERRQLAQSLGAAMSEAEHDKAELAEAMRARAAEQEHRATLELELAQAREISKSLRSETTQTSAQLESALGQLKEAQAEAARLTELGREESSRSATLTEQLAALGDTAETAQAQLLRHRAELEALTRERQTLAVELEVVRARLEAQERAQAASVEQLKAKAQALQADLERSRSQTQALEQTQQNFEAERTALGERLGESEADRQRLKEQLVQLEGLQGQVSGLERALAAAHEANAEGAAAATAAEARCGALEAHLVQESARVAELEAWGQDGAAQTSRLQVELEEAQGRLATAEAALQTRQQTEEWLLALRTKYGELETEVVGLRAEFADSRAQIELLEQERERLAGLLEDAERRGAEVLALKAKVRDMEAEAAASGRPPGGQKSGASPVVQKSGIHPAVQKSGTQPAVQKSGIQPAVQKSGAQPAVQKSGTQPAVQKLGTQPAVQKSGSSPAVPAVARGVPPLITPAEMPKVTAVATSGPAPDVFELDVETDASDEEVEEIILLEEEATDPGKKKP